MGGASIADAISARAQHTAAATASANANAAKLSGGNGDFASDAMAGHFDSLMTVLRLLLSAPNATSDAANGVGNSSGSGRGAGVTIGKLQQQQQPQEQQQQHSVPPDLVRRGLRVLEGAHRGRGLFGFSPFASVWLQPLLNDALKGLTEGAHPLLKEEVGVLVFGMAEASELQCVFMCLVCSA